MAQLERPQCGRTLSGRPSVPEFGGGFDTIASMRPRGPQNPYEIYCYQCNVTAPVGTRRCVHCGGRLSSGDGPRRAALTDLLEAEFTEADAEGDGEELTTSVGSAAPKIAMWILLLIGGSLYRFCN
jgi:hypothetical protein